MTTYHARHAVCVLAVALLVAFGPATSRAETDKAPSDTDETTRRALDAGALAPRLSFRAGGSYVGPDGDVSPIFAGKVDASRQESQGVDVAVAGGYEPHGFNTVRAVAATVAVGRSFDRLRVQANVGAGIGLEEDERSCRRSVSGSRRTPRSVLSPTWAWARFSAPELVPRKPARSS